MATKLSERLISRIKEDIGSGKYPPGFKIPSEPELMLLYGVGRSSIREAIKALALAGILKVQQGSGTFVMEHAATESIEQRLGRADFDEINAVRTLLEKELVRLAVQNYTPELLLEMERSLENRKIAIQAEDREACANADIDFHMAIAHAAGNSVLADLYKSFTLMIRDFFAKREPGGIVNFALSHHLHEQLFLAIKSRKAKAAQQVLQEILDNNY